MFGRHSRERRRVVISPLLWSLVQSGRQAETRRNSVLCAAGSLRGREACHWLQDEHETNEQSTNAREYSLLRNLAWIP
jgi:hypothetical protein